MYGLYDINLSAIDFRVLCAYRDGLESLDAISQALHYTKNATRNSLKRLIKQGEVPETIIKTKHTVLLKPVTDHIQKTYIDKYGVKPAWEISAFSLLNRLIREFKPEDMINSWDYWIKNHDGDPIKHRIRTWASDYWFNKCLIAKRKEKLNADRIKESYRPRTKEELETFAASKPRSGEVPLGNPPELSSDSLHYVAENLNAVFGISKSENVSSHKDGPQ